MPWQAGRVAAGRATAAGSRPTRISCAWREVAGEPNAETHFELLEARGGWARLGLSPFTGRRHQLRVHCAALGLPIRNDAIYPVLRPEGSDDFDQPAAAAGARDLLRRPGDRRRAALHEPARTRPAGLSWHQGDAGAARARTKLASRIDRHRIAFPGDTRMDTTQLFSLKGRTALITGGSRGIGRMIAEGYLAQGARVYISARKAAACDQTAKELSAFGHCVSLPADVSTRRRRAGAGRRPMRSTRTRSTSWSTTPAPPGARRTTSSPKAAGTRWST